MEICAEWLGLARGLFHITFSERHHTKKKKKEREREKEKETHTILRIDRESLCSNLGTFFGSIYI